MAKQSIGKQILTNITDSAKPYWLAYTPAMIKKRVILCLTENPKKWKKEYCFWTKKLPVKNNKKPILLSHENLTLIIRNFLSNKKFILFADLKSLKIQLPSSVEIAKQTIHLKMGVKIILPFLLGLLLKAGYVKQKKAMQKGDFAMRGDIIDIFPLNLKKPIRIELFGETIEKIIFNQTKSLCNKIKILPMKIQGDQVNIFHYLKPKNVCVILDEPRLKIIKEFPKFSKIIFQSFPDKKNTAQSLNISAQNNYYANLENFVRDVKNYKKHGWKIFVSAKHEKEIAKLYFQKIYQDITLIQEKFSTGFLDPKQKIALFTHQEIFGSLKKKIKQKRFKFDPLFISELKPNDYVVHIDHGIGIFSKMQKNILQEIEKEYFTINYKDSDKLFLPIDQADKITRYVGSPHPQIHRLNGALWQNLKRKTQKDTEKIAHELLETYAQRKIQPGYAFSASYSMVKKVETTFAYSETNDQIKVLQEIFQDMERAKPMDRLLVGDVGFGKTEVALRAAVKACEDKKQVIILAPTTILTEQHYQTFSQRLKDLPLNIGVVNRFRPKAEQKKILQKFQNGEIDIIIGAHRLLSQDVNFFDLGLLIIDEEQKFGVRHKEKIKKIRANLDVLTLSATPIPRTLNFSLSGIRDISTITTAPLGRKSVKTYVLPYKRKTIRQSIAKELKRNGQIYFLHNRVETIQNMAKILQAIAPNARIDTAHAQMREIDLFNVMQEFNQKKIDILVCSTIIENGIDLPNVNTLIVNNAPMFGLGSLHQLRGRIGRGKRQAFAYFLYQENTLKEKARIRLQILRDMQELGSGFEIALRDLEMRGSGNILGKEQSGNISSIGLHLYTEILNQTIQRLKTGKIEKPILEVKIDLPITASVPKNYIKKQSARLKWYQKIARIENQQNSKEIKTIFRKQFGKLPQKLSNLFWIIKLRNLARKARIKSLLCTDQTGVTSAKKTVSLLFAEEIPYKKVRKLLDYNPYWIIKENGLRIDFDKLGKNWQDELERGIKMLI